MMLMRTTMKQDDFVADKRMMLMMTTTKQDDFVADKRRMMMMTTANLVIMLLITGG